MQQGRPPSAIPTGEKPNSPLQAAHAKLAEAERCRRAGELDRAQALCEALLAEYSDYVGALQTLGAVHLAKQNFRQALSCFIQAAMHCPKDRVNLTNLGTVYLRLGARRLAAQALQEALRLQPNDADVHMSLAEVHREERDYALAAEPTKGLELRPSHADARTVVGFLSPGGPEERPPPSPGPASGRKPSRSSIRDSASGSPPYRSPKAMRSPARAQAKRIRIALRFHASRRLARLGRHVSLGCPCGVEQTRIPSTSELIASICLAWPPFVTPR